MTDRQRLLHQITPLEYKIFLQPDLQKFTFSGKESLQVYVKKITKKIALHAHNLVIEQAFITIGGKTYEAKISYDEKQMVVLLTFQATLPVGEAIVQLTFTGVISDQLKGWYKSSYMVKGETRYLATTQFEEIGAREVFPSIDDPKAKAIFHISLKIPNTLTAISNTVGTVSTEHEDGYKTVTFTPTPKMATYALAFIVGEFEYVEATTSSGVLVRVFVTPGKKEQATFALDTAVKMLPFYEKYFDIAYPLPVLDLIAIPDFDAGAMENWGAITAREVALLVDEKETSAISRQWVATVIAHELTHMWFGNLVTMHWWSDLWLNEGFASYMEYVGVDAFFPQWKVWEQFAVLDHNRALALDSLENTHPIQANITSIEKIHDMFDEVSYSKGACVIQMLVEYVGEDTFRDSMRHYLKKYAYSNSQTNDLWQAIEEVSGKKIKRIMQLYSQKPGHPLIRVTKRKDTLSLQQTRFYSNALIRETSQDETVWAIPLRRLPDGEHTKLLLMDTTSLSQPLPNEWVKYNPGEKSFVRVIYEEAFYVQFAKPIAEKILPPVDRMGLLRDAFDGAESGYLSTTNALQLTNYFAQETAYVVWSVLLSKLSKVENILNLQDFSSFAAFARKLLSPMGQHVGWEKKPTDTHENILLRSTVLSALGHYKEAKVVKKAQELFIRVAKNISVVDTDIRGVVYAIVAENGKEKEWEMLKALYISQELAQEKNRIGSALCLFEDPQLIAQTLAFTLSSQVRSQDIGRFIYLCFANPKGQQTTWEFVKAHWDELLRRMEGLSMGWLIEGAAGITNESLAKEIAAYFASHPHPKLEKTMHQVVEKMQSLIAWKKRDGEAIEKFLRKAV